MSHDILILIILMCVNDLLMCVCVFSFSLFHLEYIAVTWSKLVDLFVKHYRTQVSTHCTTYPPLSFLSPLSLLAPPPLSLLAPPPSPYMQGLVQIHTIVLGLDVLGNPVNVVRGVVSGTFDLFYEPIKVHPITTHIY